MAQAMTIPTTTTTSTAAITATLMISERVKVRAMREKSGRLWAIPGFCGSAHAYTFSASHPATGPHMSIPGFLEQAQTSQHWWQAARKEPCWTCGCVQWERSHRGKQCHLREWRICQSIHSFSKVNFVVWIFAKVYPVDACGATRQRLHR